AILKEQIVEFRKPEQASAHLGSPDLASRPAHRDPSNSLKAIVGIWSVQNRSGARIGLGERRLIEDQEPGVPLVHYVEPVIGIGRDVLRRVHAAAVGTGVRVAEELLAEHLAGLHP